MFPTLTGYSNSESSYALNTAVADNVPEVSDGLYEYTIAPDLPAGLALDTTTGVISGTPTELVNTMTYTVTAGNCMGDSSTDVDIEVHDGK
jgi:hypothetical protein